MLRAKRLDQLIRFFAEGQYFSRRSIEWSVKIKRFHYTPISFHAQGAGRASAPPCSSPDFSCRENEGESDEDPGKVLEKILPFESAIRNGNLQ